MLAGTLDGAAATLAMSAFLYAAQRAGWLGELPPRRITRRMLRRTGAPPRSRRADSVLGALAHLAFGAGGGALFEGARPERRPGSGPLAGAVFGTAVWLVSYAGWIPALRLLPPPHEDRRGRQGGMILAHLVYGAALGALADRRASGRWRAARGGAGGSPQPARR